MKRLLGVLSWLEVLQGARAPLQRGRLAQIGLGLWWAILFLIIVLVSATRSSHFIYVDF